MKACPRPVRVALPRIHFVMTLSAGCRGSGHFTVSKRPRRVEEPLERLAQAGGGRPCAHRRKVAIGVVNGAGENVELITQGVEIPPRHDELVLAQSQLACALSGHPVPLAARVRAELAWAPPAGRAEDDLSAPPAAGELIGLLPRRPTCRPLFRHDENIRASRPFSGARRPADPRSASPTLSDAWHVESIGRAVTSSPTLFMSLGVSG